MPLSTEHVPNKPLSGTELIEILAKDMAKLLASSGHFSSYVAYGRVAYKITVEIDLGNVMLEKQVMQIRSRADDVTEAFPMIGDDTATITATRERKVDSPNVARIANHLPIAAQYRDQDGKTKDRTLHYDPTDLPPQPAPIDSVRVVGNLPEAGPVAIKDKRILKAMAKEKDGGKTA